MATKVLSIEVGQGLTRIVEMDYKAKNPKIYNSFSFVTPKNVVNEGAVHCTDTFISSLKAECAKWGITTKKAIFSVTSRRIASRDVKIPYIKEKQIQDMIDANASDFFPVDLNQYELVYKVTEKVNTADDKYLMLQVLAVPKNIIDSYVEFAEMCGLTLMGLDYVGNSISVAMQGMLNQEETHAVIKAEERTTLITIISEGKVVFQRTIIYGIEGAIDVVRKTPAFGDNLTYGEAISVLCGKTCIRRHLDDIEVREEEDIDETIMQARINVTQSLRGLIANVSRILEYYLDSKDMNRIDNIHLIGLGGDFSGLSRLMSNELQQKVRVFRGMEGSTVEKTVRGELFSISSYIACVGAAMDPMKLLKNAPGKSLLNMDIKDLLNSDLAGKINPVITGAVVFGVCFAVAVGLTAYTAVKYITTEKKVEETQARVDELRASGIEEIYYEYITLEMLSGQLEEIYVSTLSRSEDLVEFIEELEEKMPSSITIMNFSANAQGVSMGMTVDTKEEAAKTLLQLKTFDSVEVVSTSGLTENTAENGETSVSFSVSLTYKAVDVEAELNGNETEETSEDEEFEDEEMLENELTEDEAADEAENTAEMEAE